MIISSILFVIYLFLIFLGRKQPDKNPFLKAAGYLADKSPIKQINSEAVKENLKILHPLHAASQQADIYYKKKLAFVLTFIFVGNCIVFFVGVSNWQTSNLVNNRITRASYQGDTLLVKLLAAAGESKKEIALEVAPIKYSQKQAEDMFQEMEKLLEGDMLAQNTSYDEVRSNLYFPNSLEGYPVEISYELDNYEYLDLDGTIKNQSLKEAVIVNIEVTLRYEAYEREFNIPVTVCPKEYTKEESLFQAVEQAIEQSDKDQAEKKDLVLPDEVRDTPITYTEIKDTGENTLFFLVIGTGILLFLLKDRELVKEVEKRRQTLLLEYPEFISKFTLLTGAGMPVKAALKKLAMDYKKNQKSKGFRNITYEELLVTIYEMESGVLEETAYKHFGKRCEIPQYVKFSGLLIQNLKKGSKDMVATLEQEVKETFEERKSIGRRLGEEAGTKLLLPMMLMLGIVMILIIVPAFLSYQI